MSWLNLVIRSFRWSGGNGRWIVDPAAHDPYGAQEFDSVGVDVGFGGGAADQALIA
jgi:hypothetical protein